MTKGNYINISHDDYITGFNLEPPEYEAAIYTFRWKFCYTYPKI